MLAHVAECACGAIEYVKSAGHIPMPPDAIEKKFRQKGWFLTRKTAICPTCHGTPKREEPTMTNANVVDIQRADPPRVMSRDQKRAMWREVDANWDDQKGRYIGSATDETIAAGLKVPWGWVRDIRVEAFGDNGRNEDMDKLLGNLRNMKATAEKHSAEALALAQKYETLAGEVAAALAKLDKI